MDATHRYTHQHVEPALALALACPLFPGSVYHPCLLSILAIRRRAKRAVKDAMRADADDAIDNMALIDSIYKAAGLPVRQPTHALTAGGTKYPPPAAARDEAR